MPGCFNCSSMRCYAFMTSLSYSLIFLQGKFSPEVRVTAMHNLIICNKWLNQHLLSLNKIHTNVLDKITDYNIHENAIHEWEDRYSTECAYIEKVNVYKHLYILTRVKNGTLILILYFIFLLLNKRVTYSKNII